MQGFCHLKQILLLTIYYSSSSALTRYRFTVSFKLQLLMIIWSCCCFYCSFGLCLSCCCFSFIVMTWSPSSHLRLFSRMNEKNARRHVSKSCNLFKPKFSNLTSIEQSFSQPQPMQYLMLDCKYSRFLMITMIIWSFSISFLFLIFSINQTMEEHWSPALK